MQDSYPKSDSFDVIFCRNVLIYFSFEDRCHVLAKLAGCLKEGGLLILGHSESMSDYRKGLEATGSSSYHKFAKSCAS
jgi:chemotaxis protein methyltransferase CheR